MKIKSLLIGSAAAVVAAPAAFAADIIIPEPEMVEYVRVCDAAGAGYWYIPGSETCLKISGSVEYSLDFDFDDNPQYPLNFSWVDNPGEVGDDFTWDDPDGNVPFWGAIEDNLTDLGIDLGDALGVLFPNDPIAAFLAGGGVDVDGGTPSNGSTPAPIGDDGIAGAEQARIVTLAIALGVDPEDLTAVFDYYLEGDPTAGAADDQGDGNDEYFGVSELISGVDSLEDLQKLKAALIDYERDNGPLFGGTDDGAPTFTNSVTEAALYNAILAFESQFEDAIENLFGYGDANDGFRHGYEAKVTFEAWNETDLGALYSNITIIGSGERGEGDSGFGDNNVEIDVAYFTLGGLHIGYNDSIFDFGVAGVSDDFGGGDTANRISYAFDAGNFTIEGGVEHDSDGDWTPNFVVKGTAEVDMFSAELAYAYDASEESSHVKGVAKFYGFELGAQWNSGFSGLVPGEYHGRYRWSVAAAYNFEATDTLTITPSIGWGDSVVWALGYSPYNELSLGVDVGWEVASGLEIGADIEYRRIQNLDGADDLDVGLSITRSF